MKTFRTHDGEELIADRLLGTGGQGEVWRARHNDRAVAVKVYHPASATEDQRRVLERLVDKGAPAKYFLWPTSLVEDSDAGSYGYVMELREPRFRSLEDFMARRIESSFRALMTASRQLADGFLRLHSLGLCYRDISFANVFFDPVTGDVRICDNDNVDVSGTVSGGVLGTPRFMAPEVVRREAVPSAETDRYSLAVLLFYMLMGGHPLDGEREANIRCLDVPALEKLYGFSPLYIFDPTDASNRPRPGLHDNPILFHPMYPKAICELFQRAFTEGLHYTAKRVRESEWRKVFSRALDSIMPCKSCGEHSFYDTARTSSAHPQVCWSCKKPLALWPRIRMGDDIVVLSRESKLYEHHLGDGHDNDEPIADVSTHPRDPNRLGLRNLSSTSWTYTRTDGTMVEVPHGKSVPIATGHKINFGPVTGEIRE